MGIYPHLASQYHARPTAKCDIAMLSVDKIPYPRKQASCNEFIHEQTMFVKFWNVSAALNSQTPFLSGLNHRINTVLLDRIVAVRKAGGGRDRHCDVINDVPFPYVYTDDVKREIRVYTLRLLANQKRESAPSMG